MLLQQVPLTHRPAIGSSRCSEQCAARPSSGSSSSRSRQCSRPIASSTSSRRVCVVATAAAPKAADTGVPVHDGRLRFWESLQQFVRPRQYAEKVMAGNKLAWGKTGLLPSKDTLFIGDVEAARSIMAAELQLGVGGDWPETFQAMLGHSSISMTTDLDLHARLRQFAGAAFTKEAVQQQLPMLQDVAATHLARWAAATSPTSSSSGSGSGSSVSGVSAAAAAAAAAPAAAPLATTEDGSMVLAYPAVRLLTFDVLARVLGLDMSAAEVKTYGDLLTTLVDGFMPPAVDLPITPFGKGLKARQQLVERIQQTLRDPQCGGALGRLRDEFGVDSPVAIDNTITLLFAGMDTSSSTITVFLSLLAQHPEVLDKVYEEQRAVKAAYGPSLTPEAYKSMQYKTAVVKETLRLAQVISYVPRMATRELAVPGGPTIPAGCPFAIALSNISAADPATKHDAQQFKPERWLDPAASKSLATHQLPFGTGQRTCLGTNLAYAEMVAVLAELASSYTLTADWDTQWADFPIKRPANQLPVRLQARRE